MKHPYLLGLMGIVLLWEARGVAQEPKPQKAAPVVVPSTSTLPVTLPCSFWRGIPAIEAHIQGEQGEEFFVLATGFNGFAIHPDAVVKHHLITKPEKTRVALLDRSIEAETTTLKSLHFGATHLDNVTANITDVNRLISHNITPNQQAPTGWIGTPILSKYQVTVDSANRTVTLEDPKSPLPKSSETYILPFTLKEGRILLKVEVEGAKPFTAVLDTGTVGILIPTSVGATLRTTDQKLISIRAASGKRGQVIQNRVPKLQVGEVELRSVGVIYISPDAPPEFDRNMAVLGMNFLRYFKVTINYAKMRLALTPITAAEQPKEP